MTNEIRKAMGWSSQIIDMTDIVTECMECHLYRLPDEKDFTHVIPPIRRYTAISHGLCPDDFAKYSKVYMENEAKKYNGKREL